MQCNPSSVWEQRSGKAVPIPPVKCNIDMYWAITYFPTSGTQIYRYIEGIPFGQGHNKQKITLPCYAADSCTGFDLEGEEKADLDTSKPEQQPLGGHETGITGRQAKSSGFKQTCALA